MMMILKSANCTGWSTTYSKIPQYQLPTQGWSLTSLGNSPTIPWTVTNCPQECDPRKVTHHHADGHRKSKPTIAILVTWWLSGIVTIVQEISCPMRLLVKVVSMYFGICSAPLWSTANPSVVPPKSIIATWKTEKLSANIIHPHLSGGLDACLTAIAWVV